MIAGPCALRSKVGEVGGLELLTGRGICGRKSWEEDAGARKGKRVCL